MKDKGRCSATGHILYRGHLCLCLVSLWTKLHLHGSIFLNTTRNNHQQLAVFWTVIPCRDTKRYRSTEEATWIFIVVETSSTMQIWFNVGEHLTFYVFIIVKHKSDIARHKCREGWVQFPLPCSYLPWQADSLSRDWFYGWNRRNMNYATA
jgi:hypothetical protein